MDYQINIATEHDFPDILLLVKEFAEFQGTPDKVTIDLNGMVAGKQHFSALIARYEGKAVGFASFFYAWYSWSGKAIYLDDLYVQQTCRNQGVGKMLFDAVIETAKKENCIKLRWQVSNWNKNAIEFYQKMGAEIDEVEINCDLRF